MTPPRGRPVVEAANYLISVYRNVAQMLLSCDPVVAEFGLIPYGNAWKPMAPIKPTLDAPTWWLPHRAVRQYHRKGRDDEELFTLGATICDPGNAAFPEPRAIASMMKLTTSNSDDLYWMPLLGHDDYPAGVGKVRTLDVREWRNKENWFNNALKLVSGGTLLTIAAPLLEIGTTLDVRERLVEPLMAEVASEKL